MSKERFCPECGAKLAENEHFCPDCGADIETTALPPEPVKPAIERSAPAKGQGSGFIGTGARINANGGISNTSNSVSTTTMTKNTSVNTQSVDNSSTVNNNTTIVMGGKDKSEYCEVCGNPFGDKHARCPKCGKQICFDCKVKSKNRCIECEKKAVNEYRVAFQQLLLTTNGNIGIAGRQMMDSKARELDVEDVKAGIEKELTDLYRPAVKPTQPVVSHEAPQNTHVFRPAAAPNTASASQSQKSIGTITGGTPVPPRGGHRDNGKNTGETKNKWLIPVLAAIVIIAALVLILKPKDKKAEPAVPLSVLSQQLYDTCMIRREKTKVLPQMPDKTRVDLFVEISNEPEYNLAAADLAAYLREYTECTDCEIRRKMRMEALVRFMTLRSLATMGKIAQAVDFIRTFLSSGKKLIVFCSLHDIVDKLKKAFPGAVTVTGRDSMANKQAAVDAFQSNPCVQLIICSIKAAGVGLTLTAASDVAFVELAWTYADCCQCEDRAHRIGQKDNVTCYYLLGRGTIDQTIYSLINRKKSIANEIMNADDDIPTDEIYFNESGKRSYRIFVVSTAFPSNGKSAAL